MATTTNTTERNEHNPYGFGDPNDRSLRKVEKDIMIPMIIRDRTRDEKCCKEVKEFSECGKESALLLVVKCRKENTVMKECLTKWYNDPDFIKECTEIYLKERSEYRRTGIRVKKDKSKRYTA